MTATTFDNIKLSKGGVTVTIATSPSDEENLTKPIKVITFPTTFDNQDIDTGSRDSLLLDLLQAEQRITINGFIVTGVSTGDTHNDAQSKKSDLKKIFLAGGVISMTYESTTFNINMDKLSIRRLNTDGQVNIDGLAEFTVKLTAIRGNNLGGG